MAAVTGTATIAVEPDLSGFKRALAQQLRDLADEFDPPPVEHLHRTVSPGVTDVAGCPLCDPKVKVHRA